MHNVHCDWVLNGSVYEYMGEIPPVISSIIYIPLSTSAIPDQLVETDRTSYKDPVWSNSFPALHRIQLTFPSSWKGVKYYVKVLSDWMHSLDDGICVILVWFGLSDVFDNVDLRVLLDKLHKFREGNVLSWICSYVSWLSIYYELLWCL